MVSQSSSDAPAGRRLALPVLSERATTRIALIMIALGGLGRLAWVLRGHVAPVNTEAFYIAKALAEGRGFADAFGVGTGPTAHLMPTVPLPAAAVYSMLGAGAPAAELTLSLWAILVVCAAIFVGERVLKELGFGPWARVAAVAAAAFAPVQPWLEVVAFRVWEAGLAALMMLSVLLWVLRLDRRTAVGWRALVGLGLANAAIFLVNPAAAIGTSGVIGLFLLRTVRPARWWIPVLTAMAVVATVVIPWGFRNEAVLGKFAPLRTGEGISMAIAYYDGRLAKGDDMARIDLARFKQISPLMGEQARARYLAVGEVAYNREAMKLATDWIRAHPDAVWPIRARNFVEFYAPPAWQWNRFVNRPVPLYEARSWFVAACAIGAFATVLQALATRRWRWLYVAALLILPALPYSITYPLLRYRYLVSTLSIMLAAAGGLRLAAWAWERTFRSATSA